MYTTIMIILMIITLPTLGIVIISRIERKIKRNKELVRLFQIMLSHPEKMGTGLCSWNHFMYDFGYFSQEEYLLVLEYIRAHKLKAVFWWDRGELEPRVQWLEEQIKKLE
jgi:hypothetical protein